MKSLFILTTLFFSSMVSSLYIHSYDFYKFISKYDKVYNTREEFDNRYSIFENNLNKIQEHNKHNTDWKLEINEWADQTWEEFKSNRVKLGTGHIHLTNKNIEYDSEIDLDLPIAVDWRNKNVVTPVKNQGQCGSCWSFSAVEAVESAVAIATGKLNVLSEQQLVDCDHIGGDNGCNGGLMTNAFQWIIQNKGLCLESDYPYKAADGTCQTTCKSIAKISSFVNVIPNNQLALKTAVAKKPLAIAVEADQMGFQFYSQGVFTGQCGTNLDHGVSLVGYGIENNVKYWLVRNSWGDTWGNKGYIKLYRDDTNSTGQCGIAMLPSYPVV